MKFIKNPYYVAGAKQATVQAELSAKTLDAFLRAKPDTDLVALDYSARLLQTDVATLEAQAAAQLGAANVQAIALPL